MNDSVTQRINAIGSKPGADAYAAIESGFRDHHHMDDTLRHSPYEHYRLVYRYGYDLGADPRYCDAAWPTVAQAARPRWEERNPGTWELFEGMIRYAWDTARCMQGTRKARPMKCIGSILIVDREPVIVDLLLEILTEAGYVTYAAPDEASALVAIAQHPPALLLLDLGCPGTHGAQRIETIRQADRATMPIVVMTTAPHDATPLLGVAAVECLPKPFDLDQLLACVARYVRPDQAVQPLASCAM